jgi:dissimilatory sulfite reductase (desulfoviridin) alpha/beta subunit
MPTLDITVGKKFTLNTQNFSSVSPTVTLTLKDVVDTDKLVEVHKNLEIIADALLHKQMESDAVTMATIKKMGFSKYFKTVKENGNMDEVVAEALRKLTELPPF